LLAQLKKLSEETRIPQSRLMDEAIEDLLKKHGKKEG
jgi:predicted transcriptional regulator